jgi:Rrf2 family iron-sulfur cluster assembly transcriptional regulator
MKLSTKSRYAISALIEIGMQGSLGPVPLSDLAASHGISLSYAEQLFSALRRQELVRGTRGPGGGFSLARPPEEITIAEIVRAIYGQDASTGRTASENHIPTRLWKLLDRRIDCFLERLTLADALEPLAENDCPVTRIHSESGS